MTGDFQLIRRAAATVLATLCILAPQPHPRAQGPVPVSDRHITYILPNYTGLLNATPAQIDAELHKLRTRLGPEGPRVRLGFTTYISIGMTSWTVDVDNADAVRAALADTIAQMDDVILRARTHGFPICLSFLTAIRETKDAAQLASEREDRRNMQWHSDNSLADGWWTYSRYARKQRRLQEAYLRELGRAVAARMAAYPDTFVAASGDGEIELSYARSVQFGGAPSVESSLVADYSPFAVAEFRDWLRRDGLYASGQPFAGQAWESAARYGDLTPNDDTNLDGHTLNGDFGTTFTTWDLAHFDWSLADPTTPDPRAIAATDFDAPSWNAMPGSIPGGFDPPRVRDRSNAWWNLWDRFRQTMVWRHNVDVARWMTTSADPVTGYTVPSSRWFSDQIPADYLFGHTPAAPDFRLDTSASPWWTADVSPYGSLGITSFNVNLGGNNFARTLAGVAPVIAARRVRWGIFEWNPSLPATVDPQVYRDDIALVERYRPSVIVPHVWDLAQLPVLDTGFEVALRELVARIRTLPLTLSRPSLSFAAVAGSALRTPAQTVRISGVPGELPAISIVGVSNFLTAQLQPDGRTLSVALANVALPPATYTGSIVVSAEATGYAPTSIPVTLRVTSSGVSTAPAGKIDSPVADDMIVSGEVPFTGWAVDDFGIAAVDVYRVPLPGEPAQSNGFVFLGTATLVDGARPDVQNAFPSYPMSYQAGWGFMVLTNMLPNQGNGVFTLVAFARDYDGRTALLGTRRIVCQNSTATLPFGTIDTPRQGETVSGIVHNFGWVLTPGAAVIPFDGSTISVFVDGVFVGRPSYNHFRADIATLFPGYTNSNGAVGLFVLDTTTLSNGVHSIAWGVRDSLGRVNGVGSRFFTVANP